MSLVRWKPVQTLPFPSDLMSVQREINKMFENVFRGGILDEETLGSAGWVPAADVSENDNEFTLQLELPGVTKDDVRITMQDNAITIRGEKKQEKESRKGNAHRVERSYGSFERTFSLPAVVKSEKIEATFSNGILTVTLPKAEEARPKQVEVKVR